jgi:dTDP-4-dehydrorhamnose 3,5-epimerase
MKRLSLEPLPMAGLFLIHRAAARDERGSLSRLFCADELAAAGWVRPVAQINHSVTARSGTVRGLHYQRHPFAEMKLVSCIRGAAWDVAVDLRRDSSTFLRWHAEEISADNGHAMLIPEGFAHGFQALTDDVELLYCHSAAYRTEAEGGLHPQDPRLAIAWPRPITGMSPRDSGQPMLTEDLEGFLP